MIAKQAETNVGAWRRAATNSIYTTNDIRPLACPVDSLIMGTRRAGCVPLGRTPAGTSCGDGIERVG